MKTILVMAGGTGGHIFPALAIAKQLSAQGHRIVWLGSQGGMESRIVPEHGFELRSIKIKGLRGKGLLSLPLIPWRLMVAIWQSFRVLREVKPDLAIGLGGFVTGPGGLMTWLMGKPLVIHEQNAIAGLSNKLLSKIATRVLTAFKVSSSFNDYEVVGNPLREDILAIAKENKAQESDKDKQALNILIVGGSLGALRLNQVVPEAIAFLSKTKNELYRQYQAINICHQAGNNKTAELIARMPELGFKQDEQKAGEGQFIFGADADDERCGPKANYKITEFISDMASHYAWADLVICRSGALTISELAVMGKPAILVPYPYAVDDHQRANAKVLSEHQAAILMGQEDLNAHTLSQTIAGLSEQRLREMADNAKAQAKPEATQKVANICQQLLK